MDVLRPGGRRADPLGGRALTRFRRAFVSREHEPARVGVELGDGAVLTLPNPTPEGAVYSADRMLQRVVAAKTIDLGRWEPEGSRRDR